jgi:hypothetical protein
MKGRRRDRYRGSQAVNPFENGERGMLGAGRDPVPVGSTGHRIQPEVEQGQTRYWFWNFSYFFLKRSMRPAVSTSFCLPVKNGWHLEQISTRMSFLVDPTSTTLPQAH